MRRAMTVRFAILVSIVLLVSPAHGQTLRCDITEKNYCEKGQGCRPVDAKVWNIIELDRETFSRCGRSGCDEYPAHISRSGVFMIIDVPGRGVFAKQSIDGSSFVEVVTLGTTVYLSFGACSPTQSK